MKKVIVIGSGFAGLSAAACLGAAGLQVTVLEKNMLPGGRARKFEAEGFTFDMGPSWYWMPDVFDRFFERFGKKTSDYYHLTRLDPSYRIWYEKGDRMDLPASRTGLRDLFEGLEPGSGAALDRFLDNASFKYEAGMHDLVYRSILTWRDLLNRKFISGALRLDLLRSHASYVRRYFKNPRLVELLEFPVLFLGAAPSKIPALYSLMNYADFSLGTWYPKGGMYQVVEAMMSIAKENGAAFKFNTPVNHMAVRDGIAEGVWSGDTYYETDYVVSCADYHHAEHDLLDNDSRTYSDRYWATRTMAPSCLIFLLGLNKRVGNLLHHTLFFDRPMKAHLADIYEQPRWPDDPQFYVCCPSKTDERVAPPDCENLFILIPVATDLPDEESIRDKYFSMVMDRMETLLGEPLRRHVIYQKSYAHNDFIADYNAFKGNAYGLANTLLQTANFKPRMRSRKIRNLFFAGQLTTPGPGVPPAIISGQVAADALVDTMRKKSRKI